LKKPYLAQQNQVAKTATRVYFFVIFMAPVKNRPEAKKKPQDRKSVHP